MSAVKDQGDHGFCTAFAVCACFEALTGKEFSEAELILRLKTQGNDDSTTDGSHLYLYPRLVRQGLILNEYFLSYEAFHKYILSRKHQLDPQHKNYQSNFPLLKPNERFCPSNADYRTAILLLKKWCRLAGLPAPERMKPDWWVVVIGVDNYKGKIKEKYPELEAKLKENPTIGYGFEMMDLSTYVETSFKMEYIEIFEPQHPSKDPLYGLKFRLHQGQPIAITIKTFGKYKLDAKGKKVLDKNWLETAPTKANNYSIGLPPAEYERHGGHAICVCGYDDNKRAFRFKNSWGTTWADKGYAWVSYDYVAQHSFKDDAFAIY